jgi:3-oxoacyl-[acyl-carrier-protein] synthase I
MYLGSCGMVCSVGLSARAACAALRAGIAKFDDLPYKDKNGQPIVGAFVLGFDFELKSGNRLVEMLALALADCLSEKAALSLQNVPLVVGLSEPSRTADEAGLAQSIIAQVQEKLGLRFHPGLSVAIPKGHTAGFEALRVARQLLGSTDVPGCLVCAVDSYVNADSLLWLEEHWRLKREDHSNGAIPGEAAAAVYVQRDAPVQDETAVKVTGLGFGKEQATILSEEPLLGLGLTAATRAALAEAKIQIHDLDFRLADVTGEAYGFKEQALVLSRLLRAHRDELPLWHCADSIGDCGAAAGLCHLAIARDAFLKDYAPGDRCACFGSAIGGDRAVIVLERRR